MKFQSITIEQLQKLMDVFMNGCDLTRPDNCYTFEALRQAMATAKRYQPAERIVLAKSVSMRNERQERRIRARKIEELMQMYGFSVRPELRAGNQSLWRVGIGDIDKPGNETVCSAKELKHAIEAAVAKELRRRQEENRERRNCQ